MKAAFTEVQRHRSGHLACRLNRTERDSKIREPIDLLGRRLLFCQDPGRSRYAASASPGALQVVIAELQDLRSQADLLEHELELGWIDHALLGGYRRMGDDEQARAIALRIAGQLVFRRTLLARP